MTAPAAATANLSRVARHSPVCAVAALLGACSPAPVDYFPLNAGAVWIYERVTETPQGRDHDELTIEVLGKRRLAQGDSFVRRNSLGNEYYFRRDTTGTYRVAKRTVVELKPRADPAPRYVLKTPYRVGTEWRNDSHPYLLERTLPYRERFNREITFRMGYTIVATDVSVEVPAGRFERCLKVRGEGVVNVYADPVMGVVEVPVTVEEWYAPGVGLVKQTRSERLDLTQIAGGSMRLELVKFAR